MAANDTPIQLHTIDRVPKYLQGNPDIHSGYRVHLSPSRCLKSIFVWTNETLNIWTHLVGFFVFALLLLYYNMCRIPEMGGDVWDHVVVTTGLVCYQFCMISSVAFHTFNCQSEADYCRWLLVDLNGISIGFVGCYIPAVYYGFYCETLWKNVYIAIITLLSALILFKRESPQSTEDESVWFKQHLILYVALAVFGVVPTVHLICLSGWSSDYVQMCLPKVVTFYMLLGVAVLIYLGKIPERFLPGRFDYIGSSHQWWHILIVLCLYYWNTSGEVVAVYWIKRGCE